MTNNIQPIVFNEQIFSCRLSSDLNLTGNLLAANPINGLGTTLTNNGALAALTIDAVVPSVGDRILLFAQTNAAQNGVYTVTNVGSASEAWVLTRAQDWCCVEQMHPGQYLSIEDGVGLKGNVYVFVRPIPNRINFDAIAFVAVAASSGGGVNPGLIDQIAIYATAGSTVSGSSTLPSLVQASPANFNNGTDADATTVLFGDGTWKNPSGVLPGNVRYVATNGSNVTGTGRIESPWATLDFAMTSITTAASNNPFQIVMLTGQHACGALALKPYVNIDGWNSNIFFSGAITADASWSGGGTVIIENFSSFTNLSGMSLNFSTSGFNNVDVLIRNINDSFISPLEFTGNLNNVSITIENMFSNQSPLFTNCNFICRNVSTINIDQVVNSAATTYTSYIIGCLLQDNFTVTGNGTPTANTYLMGSEIPIAINATGANVNLLIAADILDATNGPNLAGGATANYFNVASGINANFPVPSFYTPTTTEVTGHLVGIDNKLGVVNTSILVASGRLDGLELVGFNAGVEVTTTSQAITMGVDYIANNAAPVDFTLPATFPLFSKTRITYKGAGGFVITANPGQTLVIGASSSSSGGTLTSASVGASITLECTTANTVLTTICREGNFTPA